MTGRPISGRWHKPSILASVCFGATFAAAMMMQGDAAGAVSLRQAMAQAYRSNPRLDAERARLRATDEEVPRASAGWRPVITGSTDYGYISTKTKPRTTSHGNTNSWGYSLNLSQPVFTGFQTVNSVRQAEATVRAGRENLRLVEQQVLLQAVTAYADVLRDAALVKLRRHNVDVLTQDLTAARARRAVREITRTDVAQSRARRARAVSQLDAAKANLKASRAIYKQVIGRPPQGLVRASYRSSLLPSSLRQALSIAEHEHPNVISAKYREQAARHGVDRVRGELLPDVRLEASYSRRYDGTAAIDDEEDTRITGRVTVPLYQGGAVYARIRQAKHTHVSRLQEIQQARQEVEAGITAAWSQLSAARSRLSSDNVQLQASRTALEGVREEERVGQRTIIELLNAQQEQLDAAVALEVTRRDLVVAAYTMIAALGRLSADQLALMSEVYDAEEHYAEVREKWIGLSIVEQGVGVEPSVGERAGAALLADAGRDKDLDYDDAKVNLGGPIVQPVTKPTRPSRRKASRLRAKHRFVPGRAGRPQGAARKSAGSRAAKQSATPRPRPSPHRRMATARALNVAAESRRQTSKEASSKSSSKSSIRAKPAAAKSASQVLAKRQTANLTTSSIGQRNNMAPASGPGLVGLGQKLPRAGSRKLPIAIAGAAPPLRGAVVGAQVIGGALFRPTTAPDLTLAGGGRRITVIRGGQVD